MYQLSLRIIITKNKNKHFVFEEKGPLTTLYLKMVHEPENVKKLWVMP